MADSGTVPPSTGPVRTGRDATRILGEGTVAERTSARRCCRACTHGKSITCDARNGHVTAKDILYRRSKLVTAPGCKAARAGWTHGSKRHPSPQLGDPRPCSTLAGSRGLPHARLRPRARPGHDQFTVDPVRPRRHVGATAQREFTQHFPRPGWVEHDAEEIWATQAATIAEVLARARATADDIAAVGITNQRETTVLWDRAHGPPVAPAIVWQDRRTADACARLKADGHEPIRAPHRPVLDPYFSGTKIAWLLDTSRRCAGARSAASSPSARSTAGSRGS